MRSINPHLDACGKRGRRFLLWVALFSCLSAYVAAQSLTSELDGLVQDSSGAAVPGAAITVTNEATGVRINTKTNAAGLYRVTNLVPGPYRVEVAMSGFKTFVRQGFTLSVSQIGNLNVILDVGQVTEQVTVTGQAPLLKTEGGEAVNQVYAEREIQNLPNSSRVFTELLTYNTLTQTSGGAVPYAFIGIGGNDWTGTSTYVNGTSADDQGHTMQTPVFSSEFVQQTTLVANSFTSEFKGATAITVETKSGTNSFHGGGNFAIQDSVLNATPWGAAEKSPYRDTEWGLQLGGPIRKNRTFFFVGYQRPKQTLPGVGFDTVPTELQRAGDFSQTFDSNGNLIAIYDPATTHPDPNNPNQMTRDPFPGNVIPADRFDPVGVNILALYPLPNRTGTITGSNNFVGDFTNVAREPQYNVRLDQQWSEHHRSFGSFMRNAQDQTYNNPYNSQFNADGSVPWTYIHAWSYLVNVGHTYTPTPTWVWNFSWMRNDEWWYAQDGGYGKNLSQTLLGLTGTTPTSPLPVISVSGYNGVGGTPISNVRWDPQGQESYNVRASHTLGRHNLRFGFELERIYKTQDFQITDASLSFGTSSTGLPPGLPGTGNSAASVLLGLPTAGSLAGSPVLRRKMWVYAAYVADTWRIRDNLTLDLGLRWETITPADIRSNSTGEEYVSSFDPTTTNPVSGSPGILIWPDHAGWNQSFAHFQPRVGFSWQPWGRSSKTVVRGGAGLYYKNISGVGYYWPTIGLSGTVSGSWSTPDSGITPAFILANGYPMPPTPPTGNPGPGFGAVPIGEPPQLAISYSDIPAYRQTYSQQVTFSIQRELSTNMLAMVQYLGNFSRHVVGSFRADNTVDPSLWGPGNAQILRPFPQYGSVNNILASVNNSGYNALNAKLEKRLSGGLSFNFDYLFNKYLSDWNSHFPYNQHLSNSLQSPQQKFIAYAIYDLPWGARRRWLHSGPLAQAVGNWTITPVVRLQTGIPGTVTYITNTTNGFLEQDQGVNRIGSPNSGPRTMAQWFNTDAFAPPEPYTLGNAGQNIVDMPGSIGFDISIHRSVSIKERATVDFRADMFNAFNHSNLNSPNLTLGSPSFGVIGGKNGNRRIQLGVRCLF